MSSFENMQGILEGESDRGAVLITASMLELTLEKLLKAKLLESQNNTDALFENNGALGTFSAKIDLSYRIGVITNNQRYMFNTFRGIRNIFAHSASSLTLNYPSMKDKLDAAINHNPAIRDMYLKAWEEAATKKGFPREFINKELNSPRDILDTIFILEISILEARLKDTIRITELKPD